MKLFSRVVSAVLATVMVFSGLTITSVFAADTLVVVAGLNQLCNLE